MLHNTNIIRKLILNTIDFTPRRLMYISIVRKETTTPRLKLRVIAEHPVQHWLNLGNVVKERRVYVLKSGLSL